MTTPTALVTLPEVLAHLNMDDQDNIDTDEVQGFIDAATAFIQFRTGPIMPRTFTEVHSGGGPTIVLDNPPVLSITSVTEYWGLVAYPLTPFTFGIDSGTYAYSLDDPESGVLCRRYNGGIAGYFPRGYRNIQVVYVAGRTSVPADVRMAALEDIRGLYTQTQFSSNVGQFGAGAMDQVDQWSAPSRVNPIGAFPRLAALLEGPSRTPSIA